MADDLRRSVNEYWRNSGRISDRLPIELPNGSRVEEVSCRCVSCSSEIRREHVRGDIKPSRRGFKVTAFGFCLPCNLLSPFMYEIVEKGDSFSLEKIKFKWGSGEVVKVDFTKK